MTVATSFRNPSAAENHVLINGSLDLVDLGVPEPLITPLRILEFSIKGNDRLNPERILFLEAAHGARFGAMQTHVSAFYYEPNDVYAATDAVFTYPQPDSSVVHGLVSFVNMGTTRTSGLETKVNWALRDGQVAGAGTPHHKGTSGARLTWQSLDFDVNVHWVGRTLWNKNDFLAVVPVFEEVDPYTLVNLFVGCDLPLSHKGLRFEYQAFNLLSNEHFQMLPAQESSLVPVAGHAAEIIRSLHSVRMTYQF